MIRLATATAIAFALGVLTCSRSDAGCWRWSFASSADWPAQGVGMTLAIGVLVR